LTERIKNNFPIKIQSRRARMKREIFDELALFSNLRPHPTPGQSRGDKKQLFLFSSRLLAPRIDMGTHWAV
jgi:hypothetical protein